MRVMFIGDIFAKSGRRAVVENIERIRKEEQLDLVIANAENASHGRSLTQGNYKELIDAGVDLITMGNHTWDTQEAYSVLDENEDIVRPLNVKVGTKEAKCGFGSKVFKIEGITLRLTNLCSTMCRVKNAKLTNPFKCMQALIDKYANTDIHIVDFHAETTSEKNAFLYAFAGKVSMIVCTHTHVQTSDEKIYKNTAYITDLGMTGAKESIIGAKPDEIVAMFKGERKNFRLEPGKSDYQFNSVIVDFDKKTNKPVKIWRYNINNN